MKKSLDYVDNKQLLAAIKKWQAVRETNPNAPPCNTIGKAILDISSNLSKRYNFSGYTQDWKEQMIGDGIELCVKYIKNFNAEKYSNPHAYITTICFSAFQARIKKERKESVKKYKYFVEEVFDFEDDDMVKHVDIDFYQDMVSKIADYDGSNKKTDKHIEETLPDEDLPLVGLGLIYGSDF